MFRTTQSTGNQLIWSSSNSRARGGGGGVLSLEKGIDCGPTAMEWWLSRPVMAKKRGAVLLLYCRIEELSQSFQLIFHTKEQLYTFKFVPKS